MEPVKPSGIAHQARPLCLELLPDRPFTNLRMAVRAGVGDALVEQPGVQLLVALEPYPSGDGRLPVLPKITMLRS